MNRRRNRPNWFRIILLSLVVVGFAYIDRYLIAPLPPVGVPTATPTRPPEAYLTEAQSLFDQGKLLQSIQTYQQAVSLKPDDPAIYVALARVQVYAGQYKEAQTSAEDALLLSPNNSMAHAVRAWALDFEGSYLEAEAAIKRALELDPNNGIAHAYYVEILVDSYITGSGSFDNINKAIEESKVAQALAPDLLETHRARGYILEATANYEDAIREYQAAININKNIADLHLAVGRNYRALGDYVKAVEEFTNANALNPADPIPDLLISRTYATVGEFAKAAQFAETAVRDSPADTSLRGNLGVMYYHSLDWPSAIEQLTLVVNGGVTPDGIKITPLPLISDTRIAEFYFTYALVLAKTNRCGDALQIAQLIQARVPADEIATTNAAETIKICQQNLALPGTRPPPAASTSTP